MSGYYTTTATSDSSTTVWQNWTISYDATSTTGDTTWTNWNDNCTTSAIDSTTWSFWVNGTAVDNYQPVQPSAEAIAQAREHEAQRVKEQAEREKQRVEAQRKAEKLLVDNLTKEQQESYRERKVIPIRSRSGKNYEIHKGRQGNVRRLHEGKAVESYCIHPSEYVPDEDTMLTQLLWLRWCEEDFLRVANVTRIAA